MSKDNSIMLRISSQKGGVGKTVISVNLAVALRLMGYKVLLIDTDLSNPGVGFYLGLDDVNIGSREVMSGKVSPSKAIISHVPSGLDVLPAVVSGKTSMPTPEQLKRILSLVNDLNYDFVIVDTAPGFFLPDAAKFYHEALIITTPEMSSCVSSIRLSQVYDKSNLKHKMALNRVRNKKYEMNADEVEEAYGDPVYALFPEDEIVPLSIAEHIPAYIIDRRSQFSRAVEQLANKYGGRLKPEYVSKYPGKSGGIIAFLKRLFGIGRSG